MQDPGRVWVRPSIIPILFDVTFNGFCAQVDITHDGGSDEDIFSKARFLADEIEKKQVNDVFDLWRVPLPREGGQPATLVVCIL